MIDPKSLGTTQNAARLSFGRPSDCAACCRRVHTVHSRSWTPIRPMSVTRCHSGISIHLFFGVFGVMSNEKPASSGGSQVPLQPNVLHHTALRKKLKVHHTALHHTMHLHELCRKLAHVQLPQSTVVSAKAPAVPSRGQGTTPPSESQADKFSC